MRGSAGVTRRRSSLFAVVSEYSQSKHALAQSRILVRNFGSLVCGRHQGDRLPYFLPANDSLNPFTSVRHGSIDIGAALAYSRGTERVDGLNC